VDHKKLAGLLKLFAREDNKKIPLWQDEKDLTTEQIKERDEQIKHYAELILAKQRNGPVADIRLRFEGELTRFENVTKKTWSNREDERQYQNE
jgi:DnaB-like helicase C terminal domain